MKASVGNGIYLAYLVKNALSNYLILYRIYETSWFIFSLALFAFVGWTVSRGLALVDDFI